MRSASAAEKKLQTAREQRDDIAKTVRRLQRADAREQTKKSNRAYLQALEKLKTARGKVKERAAIVTQTRREQRTAERRLTAWEKSDTNPYTGERYQHIFSRPDLSDPAKLIEQADTMSYTAKRDAMREMKQKISRRIRSLRDTQKEYGDEVPVSDAVLEYEAAIKNLSPSDPDNFDTILLFYNKLFNSSEFEAGTIANYRKFIEGVNEFTEELEESGLTKTDVKDFYRVLNLVKKYFPDYYDDSETRKQIKLRLDAGMTWSDVWDSLKKWWGSEQENLDRERSQRNIAERKKQKEQAREMRFRQKQKEIMQKWKRGKK